MAIVYFGISAGEERATKSVGVSTGKEVELAIDNASAGASRREVDAMIEKLKKVVFNSGADYTQGV